jgi:hypothetical protein
VTAEPTLKKRKEREPLDDYPTKMPYALEMTRRVAEIWVSTREGEPHLIVEPSAGAGAFVRAANRFFPNVHVAANEIQPRYNESLSKCASFYTNTDAREFIATLGKHTRPHISGPWLFIGNPPFAPAQSHVEAILDIMEEGDMLAFLLRVNYLGGQERVRTLFEGRDTNRLRYLIPFGQRPGFKLNKDGKPGTDMTEYACFIWEAGYTGVSWTGLPHLWVPDDERLAKEG